MNGLRLSRVTMDRMLVEEIQRDPKVRRRVEASRRPLLRDGRALTDADLLERLQAMGITVDRERIDRETRIFLTSEDLASAWTQESSPSGDCDRDWAWICVTVLWERWFPDRPSQEQLDDKIQAGYANEHKDVGRTCDTWLEAWRDFLALSEKAGTTTIAEFDERFSLTQCAFNWLQDLEMELHNAGLEDARFFRQRIAFCNEFLDRFGFQDRLVTENMRRAIAESHFELGLVEEAETLLRRWLSVDPQWGSGWIGLSDGFGIFAWKRRHDWGKAIALLKEGLSVEGVRDRKAILERLLDIYSETGETGEAAVVRRQIEDLDRAEAGGFGVPGTGRGASRKASGRDPLDSASRGSASGDPGRLVSEKKAGRNDPCPCGSGKKYKKCCGR